MPRTTYICGNSWDMNDPKDCTRVVALARLLFRLILCWKRLLEDSYPFQCYSFAMQIAVELADDLAFRAAGE